MRDGKGKYKQEKVDKKREYKIKVILQFVYLKIITYCSRIKKKGDVLL